MYGTTIQERSCPRCGIRRTVRLGLSTTSFCFNCRFGWGPGAVLVAPRGDTYPFTPTEFKRLTAYRDAIRAGLYQEWSEALRASADPRLPGGSRT
jgi:hypothetical protein